MKVTLSWLREFAPIEGDPVALGGMVESYIKHIDDHLKFIHSKRANLGKPLPEGAK